MANTISSYADAQIMKALLTKDFSIIGREFEDDVITSIKAGAFLAAQNLDRVSLPAVKEVHSYAFQDAALTSIDLPWEELESIGFGAFMRATGYPQNLVFSKLTALSNGVFAGTSDNKNTQLRTVSLPLWTGSSFSEGNGFSTSNTGIFAYCTALTSISAPELQSVPNQMCYYCAALEEVVFPKASSVASGAFGYCTNLKKIDLGGAISKINSAFMNYSNNVTALILSGVTSVPTSTSSALSGSPVAKGTCYVYVPKELEATFKVASVWSNYASMIRAIEDYPDICGS